MYDSTNPLDIPADAEAVAGYLDLWAGGSWDRFTRASVKRYIARNVNEDGDTADVETGDLTPAQAPVWTRRRLAAGIVRPWCYSNTSTKSALFSAMSGAGLVLHRDWEWWSAAYSTGKPRLDPDAIATQYADPATSGGHFDLSLISDSWTQGDDMFTDADRAVMAAIFNALHRGNTDAFSVIAGSFNDDEASKAALADMQKHIDAINTGPGAPATIPPGTKIELTVQ